MTESAGDITRAEDTNANCLYERGSVMGTLTIRLSDDKHERLRQIAKQRKIRINKLVEELSTAAIVEFDAYNRFLARAARGSVENGLKLLDKPGDPGPNFQ